MKRGEYANGCNDTRKRAEHKDAGRRSSRRAAASAALCARALRHRAQQPMAVAGSPASLGSARFAQSQLRASAAGNLKALASPPIMSGLLLSCAAAGDAGGGERKSKNSQTKQHQNGGAPSSGRETAITPSWGILSARAPLEGRRGMF